MRRGLRFIVAAVCVVVCIGFPLSVNAGKKKSNAAGNSKDLYYKLSKCMVPYFAAGLKWNISKSEMSRVVQEFAKELPKIVSQSEDITESLVTESCSAYKDLKTAKEIPRADFIRYTNEMKYGVLVDRLEAIKKR